MDLDSNFNRNYNLYNISNNQKLNKMETIFKREKFDGYTHRFKIQFEIGEPFYSNVDIYSNTFDLNKVEDFINSKKTKKVLSFKIVHKASKEQDELMSKFIDDVLFGI